MRTEKLNQPEDAFSDVKPETIEAVERTAEQIAEDMDGLVKAGDSDQFRFYVNSILSTLGATIGSMTVKAGGDQKMHKTMVEDMAGAVAQGYTTGVEKASERKKVN